MDMRQILQRYGTSVIEEPGRFATMLNDIRIGEGKRQANLLLLALRDGVPDRLLSAGQGVPTAPLVGQLARCLVDDVGLTDELALWAVESWALAFGPRFERQAAPAPVARPSPPPASVVAPAAGDPRSRLLASIGWVDVPAGPFLYGEAKERRTLPEFRIMQTPVTVAMYRAYCAAGGVAMPPAARMAASTRGERLGPEALRLLREPRQGRLCRPGGQHPVWRKPLRLPRHGRQRP